MSYADDYYDKDVVADFVNDSVAACTEPPCVSPAAYLFAARLKRVCFKGQKLFRNLFLNIARQRGECFLSASLDFYCIARITQGRTLSASRAEERSVRL